jgi:TetR/AcrR family fatty acid metabolism transcriptional regulator
MAERATRGTSRRKEILQAAIEVLGDRGYDKTKIKDIAKTAGVADGTIYLYFKNKDELLIQLFEEVMERVLELFRTALSEETAADKKLRLFLFTHMKLVKEEPQLARIISVVLRQSSTFVQEYNNPLFGEFLNTIQGILEDGVEQGVFRDDVDLSVLSRALFGAMDELALAWLLSKRQDTHSTEAVSETVAKMVLGGLLRT